MTQGHTNIGCVVYILTKQTNNIAYSQTSLIRTPKNRNRYPIQNCRKQIFSFAFYPFNPETSLSGSDTKVLEQMC